MKKIILLIIAVFQFTYLLAEKQLWSYSNRALNERQAGIVNNITARKTTEAVYIITIDPTVFKEKTLTVNLNNTNIPITYTDIGGTGISYETWTGKANDKLGSVCFLINRNRISGKLNLLQGNFEICPLSDDGLHVMVKLGDSNAKCGNESVVNKVWPDKDKIKTPVTDIHNNSSIGKITSGAECFIRVLIAYTTNAQNETMSLYGRTMIEHIELAVLQTNQSYANSDVEQRMELAHLYRTSTVEQPLSVIYDCEGFSQSGDGRFEEVFGLRDLYQADMVGLIAAGYEQSDQNNLVGYSAGWDYDNPYNMFIVADYSYITSYYTYAHEFGHTQGCRHHSDLTNTPFAYGHGECNTNYKDIMTTSDCFATRLNYWSNPNIEDPDSEPLGTLWFSESYRALNTGDDTYSHHRVTPADQTISGFTLVSDYYICEYVTNILTSNNFTVDADAKAIFKAGTAVILDPGFIADNGSDFEAFIYSGCPGTSYAKSPGSSADANNVLEIKITPNPGIGVFTITAGNSQISSISLYDVTGKFIHAIKGHGNVSVEIDITDKPDGLYFIEAITPAGKISSKVSLQK